MNAPENESCPMNEQAVGFAVHGLEPDEEIEVLRHLPQCESCRAVLADAEGVFTRLGGAVEQIDPPPSLRASLMGRVAQTPQISQAGPTAPASPTGSAPIRRRLVEPPPTRSTPNGSAPVEPASGGSAPDESTSVEPTPGGSTPAVPTAGGSTPAEPTPGEPAPSGSGVESDAPEPGPSPRSEPRRRPPTAPPSRPADPGPASRGSWRSRRGRLVAAAVALIGVLAIGGLAVRTVQLQERLDAELAQDRSADELVEQLGRPGARYALLAPEGGPTAAAVVVADGERQVFPIALPPNATDRDTYVLWGIGGTGTPQPLGTFDVLPADPGLREVGTDAAGDAFAQYAISIEPGRTAPTTPTTVVAIGEVVA
jgi:hypothetical protein